MQFYTFRSFGDQIICSLITDTLTPCACQDTKLGIVIDGTAMESLGFCEWMNVINHLQTLRSQSKLEMCCSIMMQSIYNIYMMLGSILVHSALLL